MFVIFFLFVVQSIHSTDYNVRRSFDNFNVVLTRRSGLEEEISLPNEKSVHHLEELHGAENIRRTYVESEEYQKYQRRQPQQNQHNSGLDLYRFSYDDIYRIMKNLSDTYPHCSLGVVGKSGEGRDIYSFRVGTKSSHYDDKPGFKLVGNIHGDEIVGAILNVQFAHYLCTFYPFDVRVEELIDNINVYIIPSMNPDGYVHARRGNIHGVDLNRNFPDQFRKQRSHPIQPETQLMMDFAKDKRIVLGAHLHGGAQVVSYPWDGQSDGRSGRGRYSASPDDFLNRFLAKEYASRNSMMYENNREFPTGYTNGAEWYALYGGIPDWEYINHDIHSLTIELSNSKQPSGQLMTDFWNANFESLMTYASYTFKLGVSGTVQDMSGRPIEGAEIRIDGIDKHIKTTKNGKFTRLLAPGKDYRVHVYYENEEYESVNDDDYNDDQNKKKKGVKKKRIYKSQKKMVSIGKDSRKQRVIDFVISGVTNSEDDGSGRITFKSLLPWINTLIGMIFCCCCCCYACCIYACFISVCIVTSVRERKKDQLTPYMNMPNEDMDDQDDESSEDHVMRNIENDDNNENIGRLEEQQKEEQDEDLKNMINDDAENNTSGFDMMGENDVDQENEHDDDVDDEIDDGYVKN